MSLEQNGSGTGIAMRTVKSVGGRRWIMEKYKAQITEVDIEIIQKMAANDLNVTQTALELNYHRNTIVYHMEKIEKITGHNPGSFYGLVELIKKYG